jgi:hypothetical protein
MSPLCKGKGPIGYVCDLASGHAGPHSKTNGNRISWFSSLTCPGCGTVRELEIPIFVNSCYVSHCMNCLRKEVGK